MGYGGTGYATVDVDIVQTDVEAIVDGLAGGSASTLSDLEYRLLDIDGYLYDGFDGAVDWLSYIESDTYSIQSYLSGSFSGPLHDGSSGVVDWLSYIESDASYIEQYLYDNGYSAAQLLSNIESNTYELDYIEDYLYDSSSGYSAAQLLAEIYYILSDVWDSGFGAIRTVAA